MSSGEGRRARKKARTRREIYQAAMRLFRERGFDRVSIEAICEAADVARGTFFLHFPSKSALLYEFNRQVAEDFRARLDEPRGPAVSELEILVDMISERLLAEADVMSAMLREFFQTPLGAFAAEGGEDDRRELQDLLAGIIERGQKRGELRASLSPALAVATLLSTASAILAGAVFDPARTSPAEARRQFFDIILHGIAGPEPAR